MAERPDLSKLSSDEKDVLIVALLERIEELERRLAAHTVSPEEVIPWEEVKAQMLARARR